MDDLTHSVDLHAYEYPEGPLNIPTQRIVIIQCYNNVVLLSWHDVMCNFSTISQANIISIIHLVLDTKSNDNVIQNRPIDPY